MWVIAAWALGLGLVAVLLLTSRRRRLIRERVFAPTANDGSPTTVADEPAGLLTRWLIVSGYRSPAAAMTFAALTVIGFVLGLAGAIAFWRSGLVQSGSATLSSFPGGVGEIFIPAVYAAPWIILLIVTLAPWLVVRSARRERLTQIEQDLPLILELLATLGEAGLGFDAALDRILAAQPTDRPLVAEFRQFQRDALAGVPRVQALRRVAARADVLSLTILISALVQAEQVGAGVADVLRRQAEDARSRRRERALALANALPVKLLFPLVICFLPGLFVATLGPTFYQFFQFADAVIQSRGLR